MFNYKTPRMHCATVCKNHSKRYILKKHTVVTDKKNTEQKHICTSDASHTIRQDPAEISDLG